MGHDLSREQFLGLRVILVDAADEELHPDVMVAAH